MVEHVSSDVFARSFGQRTHRLAWLLGAGASASAGVPTAKDMIADFRARLFCARTKIRRSEVDVSDPIWEERITAFFDDAHGFPPAGDPGEYSAYFEAAFPLAPRSALVHRKCSKEGISVLRASSPCFVHLRRLDPLLVHHQL